MIILGGSCMNFARPVQICALAKWLISAKTGYSCIITGEVAESG